MARTPDYRPHDSMSLELQLFPIPRNVQLSVVCLSLVSSGLIERAFPDMTGGLEVGVEVYPEVTLDVLDLLLSKHISCYHLWLSHQYLVPPMSCPKYCLLFGSTGLPFLSTSLIHTAAGFFISGIHFLSGLNPNLCSTVLLSPGLTCACGGVCLFSSFVTNQLAVGSRTLSSQSWNGYPPQTSYYVPGLHPTYSHPLQSSRASP